MRCENYFACTALILGLIVTVTSCGSGEKSKDKRSTDAFVTPPFNPDDPYLVRGRWEIAVSTGEKNSRFFVRTLLGTGQAQAPMAATVAKAVKFTVDNSNFHDPVNPEGSVSYGTLDITQLQDNSLRECGTGGNQKCTTGAIRIYTTGTPGPGLWHTTEQYGLPITSGASTVGLNPAGAVIAATAAIGSKNVLKLSDFNVGTQLQIPVTVDFADAAAGSYTTTVVVEYVIQ